MAPAGDGRSGGKMLKQKRNYRKATPYDRPPPPAAEAGRESSNDRNWLTGFIYPATTKLLSSFWNPMTWSPSSSSSSEDADSEYDPEDYVQAPDEVIGLNQKRSDSPGMVETYGNDVQLFTLRKSETLHLIEQLLMHEQFSREECDRLTEIINSRVITGSMKDGRDAGPSEIPSRSTNTGHPVICSQAVAQSKKWVEEKKHGSSSKSVLDNGVCALSSCTKQDIVEGETTSPVDMAKSYMQARPPWASPDIVHNHIVNSSPVVAQLFKEGTPYSKDYLSSGSWNIQEELRKLRSKATEDMLSTYRFTENASTEPNYKAIACSFSADKIENVIKSPELDSLIPQKSVEEPLNVAAGATSHILSALESTHADLPTEALQSNARILGPEHNQDLDSVKMVERDGAASESRQTVSAEHLMDQHMVVEETTLESEAAANNSATSGINLPSDFEREQDNGPPIEGNCSENREDSLQPEEGNVLEREENSTSAERNPNMVSLSKTSVEVPSVDENISVINVSQTILGSESTPVTEKAPGRKSGRYRGRGRGRGNL